MYPEELRLSLGSASALRRLPKPNTRVPVVLHVLRKRKAAGEQGQADAGEIPSPLHKVSVGTSSLACSVGAECLQDMWLPSNLIQNNSFHVLWAFTLPSAAVTDERTFSIPLF